MTKVVFFGNERLVSGLKKTEAPILRGLIEKGYDIVAIVSNYSDSQSRNQRGLEVATVAETHNIPLFLPNRPTDIIDELHALNADIAVLAAYGRIVSQTIIDLFPLGIVNLHPSLLPQYRGPTPIESVILNGDTVTGVSIMQLSAGMDEGPVYAQRSIDVSDSETKFSLYEKVEQVSSSLFFEVLPEIIAGKITPEAQDSSKATYSKLIDKSDAVIDWHEPAVEIERKIRTYLGWPQSRALLGGIDVIIVNAHVESGSYDPGNIEITEGGKLTIGTSKDLLVIDTVKPLGKKEMPVSAFLSGYRKQIDI